jgi:glycerol-3-phosphate dehydrogenase
MANIKNKIKKVKIKHNIEFNYTIENNIVILNGEVKSYNKYLEIGKAIAAIKEVKGVVNKIIYPDYNKKETKKFKNYILKEVDVVIIGGGVIGCSIARELSKYKLKTLLIEKSSDIGCGTTKANNAMVHTGIGEKKGSLKQKLCIEGHQEFDRLSKELKFPYKKNGLLVLLTKDSLKKYKIPSFLAHFIISKIIPKYISSVSKKLGIKMEIIKKKKLFEMEPKITKNSLVALYSPTYAITCPYLFTIALAENAIKNGVEFLLNTEVLDIKINENKSNSIITNNGTINTNYIINAAGLYADDISDMANTREYTIHPKKGATIIFDKKMSNYINHNISIVKFPREEHYKGGGAITTLDGNIQWGPTIFETPDKEDTSVTSEEIKTIFDSYLQIFSDFPKDSLINYFSGLRACTFTEDFIIKQSDKVKEFIHVAGIQSPGLTAAPAISDMVIKILKDNGLKLNDNPNYNPNNEQKTILRYLNDEQKNDIIRKIPEYGRIICRCEQISKGEVLDAIHSKIPALSMDAIKRRTRTGMGRCQGGFCLPNIIKILSEETGKPIESILKNDEGSNLFIGKTKCLLKDDNDKN